MYRLIAQGSPGTLRQLGDYQDRFPEGSRGYLELELRSELAAHIVRWLDERLEDVGVPEGRVEADGRFVRIYFKTEIKPLVLIAGAIAGYILIMALVVAWKLFKLEPVAVVGIAVFIVIAVLAVLVLIAIRGRMAIGPVQVGR